MLDFDCAAADRREAILFPLPVGERVRVRGDLKTQPPTLAHGACHRAALHADPLISLDSRIKSGGKLSPHWGEVKIALRPLANRT
jgi:hypothetical protein